MLVACRAMRSLLSIALATAVAEAVAVEPVTPGDLQPRGDLLPQSGGLFDDDPADAQPDEPAYQPPSCPLSQAELHDGGGFLTQLSEPSPQSDLQNCTWYRESTCCSAEDTLRISHAVPDVRLSSTTQKCRDVLHLLMCSPCSPDQNILWVPESVGGVAVQTLRVCESFCDRLHAACGSSLLTLAGGREADRVDALFRNGADFCRAVGLRAVNASADAQTVCFSSAHGSWRHGSVRGAMAVLIAIVSCALAAGRAGD